MAKRKNISKRSKDWTEAPAGGSDVKPVAGGTPPKRMTPNAVMSPINPNTGASNGPHDGAPPGFRGGPRTNVAHRGNPHSDSPGSALSTQPPARTGDPAPGLRHNPPNTVAARPGAGYPGIAPLVESQYHEVNRVNPPPYIGDVDIDRNWFSPFQPVWPWGPPYINYPRRFDYDVGINLAFLNRRADLYTLLQNLANSGEGVLRPVIEARKDQLLRMPYKFQLRDKPKAGDDRIDELNEFFEFPDDQYDFQTWLRMVLDARFITDTACIYNWRRQNGKPYRLEVLDGTTIQVLIDDAGRIPDRGQPAYAQIIKGLPMVQFSRDEMIYAPHNPRPQLPIYGMSEVEQIYLRLTSLVRKEYYVLDSWASGTIPDMILSSPENWTPEQVGNMQSFFDTLLSGNLALKSKMRVVPYGMKPVLAKGTTAEILAALEKFEERSARIVCFTFSIPPTPFVSMMNRATSQSLADEAATEGLYPLMNWTKAVMNRIVTDWFKYEDIEFVWTPTPDVDPEKQSQTYVRYVNAGIMSRNEVRDSLDLPPDPDGSVLTVAQGATVTPLKYIANAPPPPPPMPPGMRPGLPGAPGAPQIGQNGNGQRALPAPKPKPAGKEKDDEPSISPKTDKSLQKKSLRIGLTPSRDAWQSY